MPAMSTYIAKAASFWVSHRIKDVFRVARHCPTGGSVQFYESWLQRLIAQV